MTNSLADSMAKNPWTRVDRYTGRELSRPKIRRIPSNSQFQDLDSYFEPNIVSFGPIHYGEPKLRLGERLKLKLAVEFIKKFGLDNQVLFNKIRNKIEDFSKLYEEEVTTRYRSDELLTQMFLVDGCAVLCYIYYAAQADSRDELLRIILNPKHVAFMAHDMFLLENQIPYHLLHLLISSISSSRNARKVRTSILGFISSIMFAPVERQHQHVELEDEEDRFHNQEQRFPYHLLDLFWKQLSAAPLQRSGPYIEKKLRLLTSDKYITPKESWETYTIRNITELKARGTRFRRGTRCFLTDIRYQRGTMILNPIVIGQSTIILFWNMIAYESLVDHIGFFKITSYFVFLSELIQHVDDVKELLDKDILYNNLGSDREVLNFFNKIHKCDLVSDSRAFHDIRVAMQARYFNKWGNWREELYQHYFKSPWTVIAIVAASATVASSIVQTYYTVMGYYKIE